MLAITAGKRLRLIEPATIKSTTASPTKPLPQTALDVELSTLAWTPDNSSLVVATRNTIRRYDTKGHLKKVMYSVDVEDRIGALAIKDDKTIAFAKGAEANVFDCLSNTICQTFPAHASNIVALSISSDASTLAIASSTACTIENLDNGSRANLAGLPCISITACIFHLHAPTRLLLGVGKQVLIYDVTKPSSPVKAISLASKGTGDVVAIACSPFSKTLTSVACSGGVVGLMDLDKEKALFKTIDFKTTLTSLSFTADGASLLIGTDSGQLLIQDLRSLDKPPRKLTIGSTNEPILGMIIQRKLKTTVASPSSRGTLKTDTTSKSTRLHDSTNTVSPIIRRASSAASKPVSNSTIKGAPKLARSPVPACGTVNLSGTTPRGGRKSAMSVAASTPVGKSESRKGSIGISPLNVSENFENTSLHLETLPPMPTLPLAWKTAHKRLGAGGVLSPSPPKPRTGAGKFATARAGGTLESISAAMALSKTKTGTVTNPPAAATKQIRALTATASRPSSSGSATTGRNTAPARGTLKPAPTAMPSALLSTHRSPTSSSISGILRTDKENTDTNKHSKEDNKAAMRALGVGRVPPSRPTSSRASHTESNLRTDSGVTRTTSVTSTVVGSSRGGDSRLGTRKEKRDAPAEVDKDRDDRTPSPELPSMTMAESPVRPVHKDAFLRVGGNGVRRTSAASAKEALISEAEMFDGEVDEWNSGCPDANGGSINEEDDIADVAEHLQPPALTSTCTSLQLSPMRGITQAGGAHVPPSTNTFPTPSKLPLSQASDLLRALLAESLLDFREENRAQMRGLHLDVLRVGRGVRGEVRGAVGEVMREMGVEAGVVACDCKSELDVLREENERLREEVRSLRGES